MRRACVVLAVCVLGAWSAEVALVGRRAFDATAIATARANAAFARRAAKGESALGRAREQGDGAYGDEGRGWEGWEIDVGRAREEKGGREEGGRREVVGGGEEEEGVDLEPQPLFPDELLAFFSIDADDEDYEEHEEEHEEKEEKGPQSHAPLPVSPSSSSSAPSSPSSPSSSASSSSASSSSASSSSASSSPLSSASLRRRRSAASVALLQCANIGFTAAVTVGSGATAQTFALLVDTGSQVAGIVGPACSACLGATPTYTPAATAVSLGTTWSLTYGKGSWSGKVYADTVTIGTVSVADLWFGQMTTQANFFSTSTCAFGTAAAPLNQGIVGLGYGSSSQPSFTTSAAQVLALQLCETGGRLWLGALNASYFAAGPYYVPIVPQTPSQVYYTIALSGMMFGTTSLGTAAAFTSNIVDSGTTYTYLPAAVYTAFIAQLQANAVFTAALPSLLSQGGCWTSPSYTTAQLNSLLPTWTIRVGTGAAAANLTLLPVDSYLQQIVSGSLVYYCLGIVKTSSSTGVQTILGWTAINQVISIYDQANARVGFAPTATCYNTWATSAWSACSASCGPGTQTRTVGNCVDHLGATVPNSACHFSKPSTSQACNLGSCNTGPR